MAMNPYDACPCGSGKKFKWCCTGYFDQIELALQQEQQGQHESAMRTMENLTTTHADKPPVWGYYANILFAEGKTDEAEQAIQKGFSLQPDWAMGHLLRGLFRQAEGELIGALMLFRKAAEAYPAEASSQLAQVYEMIARIETSLNHPVAARAAFEKLAAASGDDPELKQQLEAYFGSSSRLPPCAGKAYQFRATGKALPESAITGKFTDAKKAFAALTAQYPADAAAWFNLGLVHAWLGEQGSALAALEKSLELEVDDRRAEETGALILVLQCGEATAIESDFVDHRGTLPIRDGNAALQLIQTWEQEGRLLSPQVDQENGIFSALMVEEVPALLDTGTVMGKVVANVMVGMGAIRIWNFSKANVEKICVEIRDRLNLAVGEPVYSAGPANFADISTEAIHYPLRAGSMEEAQKKMADAATRFFEETWLNRPLKSLRGVTPLEAMGSAPMRKRVLGLVRFMEDCMLGAAPRRRNGENVEVITFYDFEKLRHKLGITYGTAEAPAAVAATPEAVVSRDFTSMNVAELSAVVKQELGTAELENAMKAAIRLSAHELAVAFAQAAVAKPFDVEKPDRYTFYATLMTGAMSRNDTDAAVKILEEGSKYDATYNDSLRVNEYGLRVAALQAKLKNTDKAVAAFEAVINRNPDDGNLYVKAAETMLSIKDARGAKLFAERGLARAKVLGSKDLQGACQELLEAAKRYA